ncbi:ATP-grasp domain-containing protein [Candidatus Palauibacter sp.]|uniref:ATP-grasp domain-containing protein n=1 Tax=Candidatus Palauibacter sp. TaxID=3101350 RepID=UPI003B028D5B
MHVVFVEPRFPGNQKDFVRGLHEVGAEVSAVGEAPLDALGPDLPRWLTCYEQVRSVCDESALAQALQEIHRHRPVDRLEATVEAHILPVARVREAAGLAGTSVKTAHLCRDKPAMKEALREAGVATAQSMGGGDADEILRFGSRVGYPLIVKPRAGAGASGTYRVDSEAELAALLPRLGVGHGAEVAVEEFVEGHEAFYDTLSIGGVIVHDFMTHYYPNVLEAMRTREVSPQFITTNRIDAAAPYAEVRELGKKVIDALEIGTSATHMEWFFGEKGLKFSEIGCRPPGVRAWDLYAAANEMDLYREWAACIVHGRTAQEATRRYSAGIVTLRPERDGRITGYEGLEKVESRFGEWIIDVHLPSPGTPTQPVEAGYMANAWLRLRHPDYDELRGMLDAVGRWVRVRAA